MNVVDCSATRWGRSMAFIQPFSFFLNFARGSKLGVGRVFHGDGEDAVVRIQARDQTILKSEHHQIMHTKIEEHVSQKV